MAIRDKDIDYNMPLFHKNVEMSNYLKSKFWEDFSVRGCLHSQWGMCVTHKAGNLPDSSRCPTVGQILISCLSPVCSATRLVPKSISPSTYIDMTARPHQRWPERPWPRSRLPMLTCVPPAIWSLIHRAPRYLRSRRRRRRSHTSSKVNTICVNSSSPQHL